MNQGDIWLIETQDMVRPCLVITRPWALDRMRRITVALVTTTLRSGPTQLPLGPAEGLAFECVANFDDLTVVPKSSLTARLGGLGSRRHEMCSALNALADC